jgi:hypothetical protein
MAPENGRSKIVARGTGPNEVRRGELGRGQVPAWANALVQLLDNAFVIPFTNVRIGLDAILGFVTPGAGDAASAVATAALLWLAFTLRVPKVVLVRMLANIAVDALIGAIPLVGDIFDVAFRAGQKNLDLIRNYAGNPGQKPGASDYAVLGVCLVGVLALLALPVLTGVLLIHSFVRLTGG